ncbi:flavin-containing monooxygenase [Hymenobacter weizhouensis]|uniref:flavin-containing monooxygenase n=1 Tax=Hymenobacter sp. YIM 151500-1 TaxID=2987689 RepID=UPI002225C800|nr:NAD(P)-binding domain-containing protein [Hymenobacter sp. YIM 151500-1]UYZ62273.1 NAD(P)-binding domain-containing protein [Hymenobacter sp. YIM 151500-1]
MSSSPLKICLIGAGSSGLTAAKALKEASLAFDCFEKGSALGGNWRYDNDNGLSSAYRSLHINTNRHIMSYSDFPMPESYPMFPHHSHIIRYFEDYARHFGVDELITYNTEVTSVRPGADGTWRVATRHRSGATAEQEYRAVIVANGHHWSPRYPEPPFPGHFGGEVLHSHYYRTPDQLQGRNLVIVGIGNSAVDIACEAARLHTGRVTVSTRSGAYILPNWLWGRPFDSLASPLVSRLPLGVQRLVLRAALWLAHGNQENYGVPRPRRPLLQEHPTLSQDLLNLAGRGLIQFKPNIRELQGHQILFEDGTTEPADLLLYATGYKVSFPFFDQEFLNVEEQNNLELYRRVVHPDHPGLYFLAFVQPLGAIMPLAEVQARWIARLLTGHCRLPSREAMLRSIEADKQALRRRYSQSPRHTMQVDFYPYKELIEREMRQHVVK